MRALVAPGDVVELRAPKYGGKSRNVLSGYFDDVDALVDAARQADGKAPGIYYTLNPVKPELLARRVNRCEQWVDLTTGDHDIERRRWVLIDIDPKRPTGIGSTDTQHEAAHDKAQEIAAYLTGFGFPDPVVMDSGNGAYLLYRVELPNDDASRDLVQNFLGALSRQFNDDTTEIDTSVFNAARIMRIPGTLNAKGDHTPDRPHRRARLVAGSEPEIVSAELLATVAGTKAEPSSNGQKAAYDASGDIEQVREWLEAHGLATGKAGPYKGSGYRWELEVCPFNPDHGRGESWVVVMPTGAKAAGCRHNSCTWNWRELRAKIELPEPTIRDRRRVDVSNEYGAAEWLRSEIGRGELAGIFRRGSELVHTPRIGEDGYRAPTDLGLVDAGPAQVRTVTTTGVKSLVESRYLPWRMVGTGNNQRVVEALFPQQSATSACEAARLGEYAPNLRTLHGVSHTPMIRPDGSILDAPGYDAASGFLYLPEPGLEIPAIPAEPTEDQVREAVELILTPVAEFPFVSENDRATWVGLLFTPLLRPLLPGPYQLGVCTATNSGSGKGWLTRIIGQTHGWVSKGELVRDSDELRKVITAVLIDTTAPVVAFDNLTGVVRSPVLEALATMEVWSNRLLGHSRDVSAPNDRLWLLTGNNAQFGGDLARRIASVALDPPSPMWHLKRFRLDLREWVPANRGRLLAALLTVARGWVIAGQRAEDVRSDDFARWAGSLAGMLSWAGIAGKFGGTEVETAISSDDEEWLAFLVEIHRVMNDKPWTVKELVGKIRTVGADFPPDKLDPDKLPGDLSDRWDRVGLNGRTGGFSRSLGLWLKNRKGRYAGGWKIIAAPKDTHANAERYAVQPS
jgi:hypothetical protein